MPSPDEKKNEIDSLGSLPVAVAADHQRLVASYEALRGYVLGEREGCTGPGLALFLHKGMAAWMEACVRSTPPPQRRSEPESAPSADLPPGLHGELVVVLTAMVLSHFQEGWR